MSPKKRKAKIALPQPKKTKGRRGSRAYLNGGIIDAIYGAAEYRIWRIAKYGKWVESSQIGQGDQDSRVHRYGREHGFKGEEDQVQNDDRALKVLQEMQGRKIVLYIL
jgi:hypothetical protein